DSRDAFASSHRPVFFHHAGAALVGLGMVVRHSAGNSPSGLRIEWSSLALRSAGGRDFRSAAFAAGVARRRPAFGGCAHAAGGGGLDDSSLCASAYCELAFFSALVCCAGAVGRLGARAAATLATLVFSRLDAAVGESAWRMAFWNSAARNLRPRRIRGESARAQCVGRDSRRASGSCHGFGLGGLGGGDAGESLRLAAACAHLSLSERSLSDEPDRRVQIAGFSRLGAALLCDHPGAYADRVLG